MSVLKDKEYSEIVGYGIGQYYEKTKTALSKIVQLDYLCDRKWDNGAKEKYDDIPLIRRADLKKLKKCLVIIFTSSSWIYKSIKGDLDALGVAYIHVDEILGKNCDLDGKLLKEKFPDGKYVDKRGNKIFFDRSLSDNVTVKFQGSENILRIGKNVSVGNLHITFGNKGFVSIDQNTEIIGAEFYVSDAKIQVGKDCLFASQIILRTHDSHHIFDIHTHERLNYAKDISIGNNVWIAYRATLLGGARIGTGSVVGTCAVTSGQFEDHLVIAGAPAKIIKENICWSRDDTSYFNRDSLEECISREAINYVN